MAVTTVRTHTTVKDLKEALAGLDENLQVYAYDETEEVWAGDFIVKDGSLSYSLQTRADGRYGAASVFLEAPDPCEPDYKALWENYDAR